MYNGGQNYNNSHMNNPNMNNHMRNNYGYQMGSFMGTNLQQQVPGMQNNLLPYNQMNTFNPMSSGANLDSNLMDQSGSHKRYRNRSACMFEFDYKHPFFI